MGDILIGFYHRFCPTKRVGFNNFQGGSNMEKLEKQMDALLRLCAAETEEEPEKL